MSVRGVEGVTRRQNCFQCRVARGNFGFSAGRRGADERKGESREKALGVQGHALSQIINFSPFRRILNSSSSSSSMPLAKTSQPTPPVILRITTDRWTTLEKTHHRHRAKVIDTYRRFVSSREPHRFPVPPHLICLHRSTSRSVSSPETSSPDVEFDVRSN